MPQEPIDPATFQRIQAWLKGPYDLQTKEQIQKLLKEDPQALSDAFFKDLEFGTGGMRGVMGVGTNRMNLYIIQQATQGLANYLQKQHSGPISVFIGYDVRHQSKEFATEAALVLAGNGIQVFLTKEICPTPLVSFGCRHFGCQAAIMITASHNPPQYNGYKVYGKDGGQVVAPQDRGIIEEYKNVTKIQKADLSSDLIHYVDHTLDTLYLEQAQSLQLFPSNTAKDLRILYTPLHGTGIRILPKMLTSWGFKEVALVKEQSTPDGDFPKAPKPNPEEKESLALGREQLIREKADLLIATDPDADRVGIVERGQEPFTGNQIACLLLNYICQSLQKKGTLPAKATCIKTIVTTELFHKIAKSYGVECIDVLTGFKYIAEKMTQWEKTKIPVFLFGAEESFGYLYGTLVRDKDALSTSCLLSEAAALAKSEKKTLTDQLQELYQKHGTYRELLQSIAFGNTEEGLNQMNALMERLRKSPPQTLDQLRVEKVEDFQRGLGDLPPSNVIRLWCQDQTKIVIRPSGTEPKMKIYIEVTDKNPEAADKKAKSLLKALQAALLL